MWEIWRALRRLRGVRGCRGSGLGGIMSYGALVGLAAIFQSISFHFEEMGFYLDREIGYCRVQGSTFGPFARVCPSSGPAPLELSGTLVPKTMRDQKEKNSRTRISLREMPSFSRNTRRSGLTSITTTLRGRCVLSKVGDRCWPWPRRENQPGRVLLLERRVGGRGMARMGFILNA